MAGLYGVVLDNGTDELRVGFTGELSPFSVIPNIVGEVRFKRVCGLPITSAETRRVGDEVIKSIGLLKTTRPMNHGAIVNFDAMEDVWSYMYSTELRREPSELPLLFLKKEDASRKEVETIQEILFEKFRVPILGMINQGFALCQSMATTTGCFVTIGTCITLIHLYEGHHLEEFDKRYNFGGGEVTEMLGRSLAMRYGPGLTIGNGYDEDLESIKRDYCFVSENFADQLYDEGQQNVRIDIKLVDGRRISLKQERFIAPEIYFQPKLYAQTDNIPSLPDMIIKAITSCPFDTWDALLGNIVLGGGEASYPGLAERLKNEIQGQVNCDVLITTIESPKEATWVAGSTIAALPNYEDTVLPYEAYHEGSFIF